MTDIAFTIDNVSRVAVSPINADATTQTSAANNTMTFAGIVIASQGLPYEAIPVTANNWVSKLGRPMHPSMGKFADSLRSLDEATRGGNGIVVRVVPPEATRGIFVSQYMKATKALSLVAKAQPYTTELTFSATADAVDCFALLEKQTVPFLVGYYPVMDIALASAETYGEGMYTFTLKHVAVVSEDVGEGKAKSKIKAVAEAIPDIVIETIVGSFNPLAVDSMGAPAYIENVFEASTYFECRVNTDAIDFLQDITTATTNADFVASVAGDPANITAAEYQKAIDVLKTTLSSFNYVCGLSCYDEGVIQQLADICRNKRISGYFDVDPRLSHTAALEWKQKLGLNNHRASFVHVPYNARCRFYGTQAMWGGSGAAFAAKAAGVAMTSPVGGWHYTPAGVARATIQRSNLIVNENAGEPNYQAMYTARLNKLGTSETGSLFIDDSLTSYPIENYLRFEQVVSIADAISRDFYALGNRLKHEPDGTTLESLTDGMSDILNGYEASGALVTPRNPEQDGEAAWTFTVEQVEIDFWKVTWSFCPTGSARRILGEPVLIR